MPDNTPDRADCPSWVEQTARCFHEAYERLAPSFSYDTRPESAVPWEDVPEANRALMVATVAAVLTERQDAYDKAVGMLYDIVEAFPIGAPGDHLAWSFRGVLAGELIPLVSAERQADWAAEDAHKNGRPS